MDAQSKGLDRKSPSIQLSGAVCPLGVVAYRPSRIPDENLTHHALERVAALILRHTMSPSRLRQDTYPDSSICRQGIRPRDLACGPYQNLGMIMQTADRIDGVPRLQAEIPSLLDIATVKEERFVLAA